MNIFKVLASGKKSFQEETASAILMWFLHPSMEHGLGYSFLSKFIREMSISLNSSELPALAERLKPRMRGEYGSQETPWFNLEENVDNAFVDIIIGIDDWIIAIENKIYPGSISMDQLSREYNGIKVKKEFCDKKIIMVYIVPVEEDSEMPDGKIEKEFENLSVSESHFKILVTWQRNRIDNVPSISELVGEILAEESKGMIDPISEYTRHTLKALISFISNNFSGYDYERINRRSGLNSLTEETLPVDKLRNKAFGYVGVKGGIRGLLNMYISSIKTYEFQYTSSDMSRKPYWLEVDTFKKIIYWIIDNKINDIEWKGRLSSKNLYMIAKDFGPKVFIGIKGGEKALRNMSSDEIKNREWNISTIKASSQWVDGELFYRIMDEKQIY